MKKNFLPLVFLIVSCVVFAWFFIMQKSVPLVLVSRAEYGPIRDSVTGNVKVHASATFDLKAQANSKVDWVALLPLGGTLSVEENQTLIKLVQDDLDRQMDRLLLDKKQFNERRNIGSPTKIFLDIKERELLSTEELAKIENVPVYNFELLDNEVKRLRTQVELEKITNNHFLENLEHSLSNLNAEIEKRTISSPIDGEFATCLVAPGNQVFTGNVVGRVYSKRRIIEVSLNEEDFHGLRTGLAAGVTFFSHGNDVFEANVSALSATVDSNSGVRKLYLKLVSEDISIPVGSSGRAEVIKSKKNKALLIPRKALIGDFVVVEKDGLAQFRKIIVGAQNLLTVEVLEGLGEGEKVVIQTPHVLKDGERVKSTLVGIKK